MKKYVIVESVAAASIRWFMIDQNSFEECERSFLDDRFLISYSGTAPEFLDNISQKSQEYTKEEVIPLLVDVEWSVFTSIGESDDWESEVARKKQFYEGII